MATLIARRDEFATSTDRVRDLRRWKDDLYQRQMPKNEVVDLVERYFRRAAYAHLENRNPVFLVVPSTTGANKLPYYFAKRLQSELGGDVVTGWAAPLERQKASVKGGLGKMRHPAKFAAIDDKLAAIPRDRPIVLVDDVVTTGETTDALRELLEQRELEINTVASLGQSEMRKVNARDIERLTAKLGEPKLNREVAGVLNGRLKHKANYIERVIHEDTRQEIRDYFVHEHQRLQELGTVQPGRDRSLRRGHPSNPGLQLQESAEAGDPSGSEPEVGPGAGHAARDGKPSVEVRSAASIERGQADIIFQLEELQEMVRRGMDVQQAREYGLQILDADKMHAAPKMLVNYELSQALKGERSARPMKEIVQFSQEMTQPQRQARKVPAKRRMG